MANRNNVLFGRIAVDLQLLSDDVVKPLLKDHLNASDRAFEHALVRASLITEHESARIREELARLLDQHDGDADSALEALDESGAGGSDAAASYMNPTLQGASGAWRELSEEVDIGAADDGSRYRDATEHARGGMGRILMVQDTRMNRSVALKELIPPTDAGGATLLGQDTARESAHLVQRFLREARITGSLEHPSIVPVYELGRRADGSHYYTMKFVRGRSLHHAIYAAQGLAERLKLLPHVIDLCQAIAYAHDKGVIHRDIKPSNVMVGSFGETVVIDWGLARVLHQHDPYAQDLEAFTAAQLETGHESPTRTAGGFPVGTPHYMPPEQAEGRLDDVGPRSDVYSLGVVLYELLTGTTPYTGASSRVILQKVRTVNPPGVLMREPAIPPALAAICARAMARKPEHRYASAGDLAEELSRFTTGALVQGYEYSFWELLRHHYRRHRALCNTVIAAATITLAVAATSYAHILEANRREREQRIAAEAARGQAESSAYRAGIQLAANHVSDQQFQKALTTLMEQPIAQRNWEWGLLFEACNQDYATVSDHTEPVYNIHGVQGDRILSIGYGDKVAIRSGADLASLYEVPVADLPDVGAAVSADGAWLAITRLDGVLQLHDIAAGTLRHELSMPGVALGAAAFSGDGAYVAAGSRGGSVYTWNTATGELVRQIKGHDASCSVLAMSRDGSRAVAFDSAGRTVVWDIHAGTARHEFSGIARSVSADGRAIALLENRAARVYDVESGALRFESEPMPEITRPPLMNTAGTRLAALVQDGQVRIWDVETGGVIAELRDEAITSTLAFSPDGGMIALGARPHAVQLWRVHDGRLLQTLKGHSNSVRMGVFSDDGDMFYTCAGDPEIKAWRVRDEGADFIPGSPNSVNDISISESNSMVAVGTAEGAVYFVDTESFEPRMALGSFDVNSFVQTALGPESSRAAVSLGTCTVFVVQIPDATVISRWESIEGSISQLGASPDGEVIVAAIASNAVPVWSAETGEGLLRFEGHEDRVQALAFAPDGDRVASGDRAGRVLLWNWRTGAMVQEVHRSGPAVTALAFSEDGTQLAVAFERASVVVYEPDSNRAPRALTGSESDRASIAFSSSGTRLAGLSGDRFLGFWDAASGQALASGENTFAAASRLVLDHAHDRVLVGTRGFGLMVRVATPREIYQNDLTLPASMAQYKRAREVMSGPVDIRAETVVAFTTATVMREAAGRIETATPGPETGGYLEPAHNPLKRLGLRAGDRLNAIDGQNSTGPEHLAARLREFTLAAEGQSMMLEIQRGSERLAIEQRSVAESVQELGLKFGRDHALRMLRDTLTLLQTYDGTIREYSQHRATYQGSTLEGPDAINGLWVPPTTRLEEEQGLAELGLADGDSIRLVNDQPVTSYRQIATWIQSALDALESGATGTVRLRVQRDRFSVKNLTWSVE